jgi:hypothetical protein
VWWATPEAVAALLGAFALYPLAVWRWGYLVVAQTLFDPLDPNRQKLVGTTHDLARIGLVLFGMVASAIFSALTLGLVLRALWYGMDGKP